MPARKTEESNESEIVVKAEPLPENLLVTANGTRLLYHKNRIPAAKIQEYLTTIFLKTNLDEKGQVKEGSTKEQLETVQRFLNLIKSIATYRVFELFDGLPEDDSWILPLQLAPLETDSQRFDFSNPKHLEILYVQNYALSTEDLEAVVDIINS